jgi:hypothetical protein
MVLFVLFGICVGAIFSSVPASGQAVVPQPHIVQALDESQLTTLTGNVHPLARAQYDRGAAPAELPIQRMLLVLKRSAEQEAALRKLLDDQQDKTSPNFHKWLTPEEFGQQFGPVDSDIQTITAWLQSHGFQVAGVSKGRTVVEFSGNAAQVLEAFHTAIHKFTVNGEDHWANASDPQIPAALTPVVAGVNTLHNFPRHSMAHITGTVSRSKATGVITPAQPLYTIATPGSGCGVQSGYCYGVGPYDFATIYNVLPLWNAAPTPINGSGQTIAVVGESDINPQDIADFRNFFGLPAANLQVDHDGPAPGLNGAETEAVLDLEWSGAVAPGASQEFVVAESTETALGVDLAAQHVVDNNLAPILSESFGICELGLGTTGNQFLSQLWQQAAAQGTTVLLASGDSGSAGCDNFDATPPSPAQFGLAVSGFASTPYNIAVGGSDFFDLSNGSAYWNTTNAATTQASAKSYIPETTWNDTCTNPVFGTLLGYSMNAETNCNNSRLIPNFVATVGGSGGKSSCTASNGQSPASCSGGYAKPSWQTALTPADGKRDIPDVSLFAASGSPSGSFYLVCEADAIQGGSSCNPADSSTQLLGIGGTSASTPAMAGILALVAQKNGGRLGNANYVLYKLAGQQTNAGCNSSNGSGSACVFNDITTGTIAMPCATGSPNCTTTINGDQYGILSGYATATGYDLATGLGSVNVANLASKWAAVTLTPSVTTLSSLTPTTITHGQPVNFGVSVAPQSGTGTPTGTVSLLTSLTSNGDGVGSALLNAGSASGTTSVLPGGTYNVTAHYAGDGTFGSSDSSPISVTVNKENSNVQVGLITLDSTGHILSNNATTAVYGSPYILQAGVTGTTCSSNTPGQGGCPTGTLSLSDNGSPLDAGTYPLNTLGSTLDLSIQLSGGSHAVQASYAGDNSFNPGVGSAAIGITPASTTMAAPTVYWPFVDNVNPMQFDATVVSSGSGVAPTGTITFMVNGTPITGNQIYSPTPGSAGGQPLLAAILTTLGPVFPTTGNYTVTAVYSGDTNYASVTSAGTSLHVMHGAPNLTFNTSSTSVAPGSSVTFTVGVISNSKTVAPTGTVTFQGMQGAISSSPTYSSITDANGHLGLQAVLTFTPQGSDDYTFSYSGDSNYPGNAGMTGLIAVTGNDFSLSFNGPTSVTVSPGSSGQLTLVVDMQAGTAPVSFSANPCTGLPAEATCNLGSTGASSTAKDPLSVGTTAPHTTARPAGNSARLLWLQTISAAGLAGIFVVGVSGRKRRWGALLALILIAFLVCIPGCGGGSSFNSGGSGGGGGGGGGGVTTDPGTPAGTYAITVTGTSGTITHTVTFQLVVQ